MDMSSARGRVGSQSPSTQQAVKMTDETFKRMCNSLVGKINHLNHHSGMTLTKDDLRGKKAKVYFALCMGYPTSPTGSTLHDIMLSTAENFDSIFGAGNWEYEFLFHHKDDDARRKFEEENETLLNSTLFAGHWDLIENHRKTANWKKIEALLAALPPAEKTAFDQALLADAQEECQRLNAKLNPKRVEQGLDVPHTLESMVEYSRSIVIDYLSFMPRKSDGDLLTALFTPHEYNLKSWKRAHVSAVHLDSLVNQFAVVKFGIQKILNRADSAPPVGKEVLPVVDKKHNVHPGGYHSNDETVSVTANKISPRATERKPSTQTTSREVSIAQKVYSTAAITIALSPAHTPELNAENAARLIYEGAMLAKLNTRSATPGMLNQSSSSPSPSSPNSPPKPPKRVVVVRKRRSLSPGSISSSATDAMLAPLSTSLPSSSNMTVFAQTPAPVATSGSIRGASVGSGDLPVPTVRA